jgi:hypothetical protein
MTEMKTWLPTVRRYGIDIGRDEPSHIHLPRRRRRVRPDAESIGTTWPADVGGEDRRIEAQGMSAEA